MGWNFPVGCAPWIDKGYPWQPTRDIEAAWMIVAEMARRGFYFGVQSFFLGDGGWYAGFHPADYNTAGATVKGPRAETAPLAICLAALKAVGVDYALE
jgi:hypothetical protein